jgi:small-conductance mechanosensitive channel
MSEAMQAPDHDQPGASEKQTPDEIVADIEATRDRLAGNLDALTDKLDVKAHAADAVHDAGAKVQATVADAKESVASAAGSAAQQSRTLVDKFRALPLAAQAAIGAGAAALVVTLIVRSARS